MNTFPCGLNCNGVVRVVLQLLNVLRSDSLEEAAVTSARGAGVIGSKDFPDQCRAVRCATAVFHRVLLETKGN